MTNDNTYLSSASVADLLLSLGNAFMCHRDDFDFSQYRDTKQLEDCIMNVVIQYNILIEPCYFAVIREIIAALISEPSLYAEWSSDDEEYFAKQMLLDLTDDDEFSF